eukprot:96432-Amphidinium_carterae.1
MTSYRIAFISLIARDRGDGCLAPPSLPADFCTLVGFCFKSLHCDYNHSEMSLKDRCAIRLSLLAWDNPALLTGVSAMI